ncbi:hypothetical protein SAMN04489724_1489 [Algoriphagus locisalis]|uniref:Uncharacterized protein n=1 Tax=Algoriphagus locisalis TaxID=305507 RepID=A0A1I6ZV96_9BACT|nr:hypothetical protein [Algoriphagus locisalis]SFT66602.1 hypothetical protein SAMN04489724_1489 [Algoriphagus locisalis]
MSVAELKKTLKQKVDLISDEVMLEILIDIVNQVDDGTSVIQLTEEQKDQLFKSYDESFDESNLIDWSDVKKSII